MTKVTSRLYRNVSSDASGTKIVWRGNCAHFHLYAVFRTHPGPKPTWWHTPSRSSAGIYTTMQINSGRIPSTRIHVGRVNKQVCNHGCWTTHSKAVLKPTTQVYLSGHQELIIPNIHVEQFYRDKFFPNQIPVTYQSVINPSSGFKRVFSTPLSCRTRPTRHSISSP